MAGIDDFLDLMPSTFQVYTFVSRDTYGKAKYLLTPKSYRGHKNDKQHFIRAANGEQVVSSGMIWLATTDPISVNDKVVLPDGTIPQILNVNGADDELGPLYVRIDMG